MQFAHPDKPGKVTVDMGVRQIPSGRSNQSFDRLVALAIGSIDMVSQVYALIHEEAGVFGISFPDFPGCISGGESAEEALARGRETLAFHIAGMVEDGDTIPPLRSFAELQKDKAFNKAAKGAILALVPADLPGRAARINISIEEGLLDRIDQAAKERGESRSRFLASAAKERLRKA